MENLPLKGDKKVSSNVRYQSLEVSRDDADDHCAADNSDSRDQRCTVFETSCNLAKVITGSGMLSLPYAVASAGWLSLGALVGLGLIFSYAFDLLVAAIDAFRQSDAYEPGTTVNYVTLGKHCFGKHGDKLVLSIFATELVLALMSFFMNIAINMEVLSSLVTYEAAVCLACATNIFLCSFELKLAAYSSAIGYFMIGFVLVALLWCGEEMEAAADQAALDRRYAFLHASGLPLAAGLVAFCFGGHSTFPKLYAAMEEPRRYREVIWSAMAVVIVLYVSFAAVGYAAYAQYTEAPVTLNIGRDTQGRVFPDGAFLRYTAAVGVVCNLLVTCPLVTLPVTDTLNLLCQRRPDPQSQQSQQMEQQQEADEQRVSREARVAVVTTSAGVSVVAALLALSLGKTQFAPACGLIGAVASFSDSLLLPVFFFHCLVRRRHSTRLLATHAAMTLLGVACFAAGVASTLCRGLDSTTGLCAYVVPPPSSSSSSS